jgi:hypothetical protein
MKKQQLDELRSVALAYTRDVLPDFEAIPGAAAPHVVLETQIEPQEVVFTLRVPTPEPETGKPLIVVAVDRESRSARLVETTLAPLGTRGRAILEGSRLVVQESATVVGQIESVSSVRHRRLAVLRKERGEIEPGMILCSAGYGSRWKVATLKILDASLVDTVLDPANKDYLGTE